AFGTTLLDHNSANIPTTVGDPIGLTCAPAATATSTAAATPIATATPTNTVAPVRVGGVADVHIIGAPRSAAAAAGDGGSRKGRAMAFAFATVSAVAVAASGWYIKKRRRVHLRS